VVAGATSQIGPVSQPTLDEVIRKTIKVTLAENGIMKTINVENLKSAVDLLERVLRKFGHTSTAGQASGRSVNVDDWALSPMPLNALPAELNWGTSYSALPHLFLFFFSHSKSLIDELYQNRYYQSIG
jgi:hypothetical protein